MLKCSPPLQLEQVVAIRHHILIIWMELTCLQLIWSQYMDTCSSKAPEFVGENQVSIKISQGQSSGKLSIMVAYKTIQNIEMFSLTLTNHYWKWKELQFCLEEVVYQKSIKVLVWEAPKRPRVNSYAWNCYWVHAIEIFFFFFIG